MFRQAAITVACLAGSCVGFVVAVALALTSTTPSASDRLVSVLLAVCWFAGGLWLSREFILCHRIRLRLTVASRDENGCPSVLVDEQTGRRYLMRLSYDGEHPLETEEPTSCRWALVVSRFPVSRGEDAGAYVVHRARAVPE